MTNIFQFRFVVVLSLLFAVTFSAYSFRPAPPPGTPKLIITPAAEIDYVYADAVVMDTIAQVVFMSSLILPSGTDSFSLTPDWPIDSVSVFALSKDSFNQVAKTLSYQSSVWFAAESGTIIVRISYETVAYGLLAEQGGQLVYGNSFALYPPFEDSSGNLLYPKAASVRFLLPPEMQPVTCADDFTAERSIGEFVMWSYTGDAKIEHICHFSDKY